MLLFRPLIHYADFEGRSRRGEYMQFMFAQALFAGTMSVLVLRVIAAGGGSIGVATPILLGFMLLFGVVLLLPNLALQVRRLHDSNRSARWMGLVLPGVLAPVVLIGSSVTVLQEMTAGGPSREAMTAFMGSLSTVAVIWLIGSVCNVSLFVMLLMRGTPGTNRFGPDPRDEAAQDDTESYLFNDAHLEVLFAEARREARTPYSNPGPPFRQEPVPNRRTQATPSRKWGGDARPQALTPAGSFGRRGG